MANEKSDASTSQKKCSEAEQRASLPDIPLTNREKAELENAMLMQSSQSSESVLIEPPPKPSKDRKPPPPLPPKKKTQSIDEELPSEINRDFQPNFDSCDDLATFDPIEYKLTFGEGLSETDSSSSRIAITSHFKESSFSSIDTHSNVKFAQGSVNSFEVISNKSHKIDTSFGFLSISKDESFGFSDEQPPPLPIKTRSRSLRLEPCKSIYDNVEDRNRNSLDTKASTTSSNSSLTSSLSARTETNLEFNHLQTSVKNKYRSCIEKGSNYAMDRTDENPPPLPLKKKHSK